jgi:hypothetical protein
MSVGLAWRLVWSGIATEQDVEAALREQVLEGVPFLRALLGRSPDVSRALADELSTDGSADIAVDSELAAHLPPGAAAAFLAVPIGRDGETGVVLVAAADPLDGHVAQELAFHLGEPVRLVPAPLERLLAALEGPPRTDPAEQGPPARVTAVPLGRVGLGRAPPKPRGGTPAHGTPELTALRERGPTVVSPTVILSGAPTRPSEPPIPLVRVSPSIAPAAGRPGGSPRAAPRTTGLDELVLSLTKSKASSSRPSAGRSQADATAADLDLEPALESLSTAESADAVVAALVQGAAPLAHAVVAFGVRSDGFVGRDAAGAVDSARARALQVPQDRPSVLKTATELGQYLGPIPRTEVHRDLAALLPAADAEVSVHAVTVGGKAAVVLVLAGIANPYVTTGHGAHLVRTASKALEALVRARKK